MEENRKAFSKLRRRAEALLQGMQADEEKTGLSLDEIRRLLYELDTHQIELELQNEDLLAAQEELQRSNRRYTELYDLAPVAYLTLDEQAKILEVNLTAAESLGVPRQKISGRSFTDFIAPEDQDHFYRKRRELLESRRKLSFELRLKNNRNELFHAFIVAEVPVEDLDPGQFRLVINDISQRKEAELENVRALKDRYRAIVMDQSELICRFDTEGRITFANDAYCRYFGVRRDEVMGTNFLPNVHEEDTQLVREHFRNLTPAEPVKTIEHRVYRPDGRIAWQEWSGRALFDRAGNILECQAVGRDITQLKHAQEKLEGQLKLLQLFLDALPCMAILVRYPSREIIAVNKQAEAAGARPGTPCFEIFGETTEPCHWCLSDKLWQTREPQSCQFWAFDLFWDSYWIPVDNDLYLQYAFDITEHEKNKEALRQAKEECERIVTARTLDLQKSHEQLVHAEKLAAVGSLSASIAHEFNNPLQSIMTIIKGIGQYAELSDKESELLNLALQECKRMAGLIANLQDFHRPSTGKVEPVNLHVILDALLLMVKKEYHNRKITVVKEYGGELPPIDGVVDQLKQVFLNLLNNAADACERGGGTITVSTELLEGEKVAVRVRDTGVGIDPGNIPHIFQPFFTTKAARRGTGLGLPVSWGIVKKHGGDIEVSSERGKGSTFSIIFPLSEVQHEPKDHPAGR